MIEIFIPFYGEPTYLRLAVESVLDQTDARWRLVILDDNPPDPSDKVSAWVDGLHDDRIIYRRNEQRLGVSGAFQRCADLATAPYVTILGCDDLLHPRYVEVVLRGHETHRSAAAVQPRVTVIDADGSSVRPLGDRVKNLLEPRQGRAHVICGEELATSLLRGAWHYFPAICWSRDLLRQHGFRSEYESTLDLALLLELAMDGGAFVLLQETAFSYRRHASSASSVNARNVSRFAEEGAVFDEFAARCRDRGWRGAERAARWHLTSRIHALLHATASCRSGRGYVGRELTRFALKRSTSDMSRSAHNDTRDAAYAHRLKGSTRSWRRVFRVQAPCEWNLRRYRLGRTLDVGCGIGRNLRTLSPDSVGVDHNEYAVAMARAAGLRAVTVHEWAEKEVDEGSFDSLLVAHVLEHMERTQALDLLNEYTRYVRPGGKVLIICPQLRGFASDPTHVEHFDADDLTDLAREAGLTVSGARSFPFPATVGRAFYANETVVLAQTPSAS